VGYGADLIHRRGLPDTCNRYNENIHHDNGKAVSAWRTAAWRGSDDPS
jgi:hypothetical protein